MTKKELKAAQEKTVASFTPVSDTVFMMQTYQDYFLESIVKNGVSNVGKLLSFVVKTQKLGTKLGMKAGNGFACTTFNALNEKGDHILGRNFDYRDAPVCVNWTAPEGGYKSISIMNMNFLLYGYKWNRAAKSAMRKQLLLAPYVLMDGMNEKGLAIDVVEIKGVKCKQKTGKKPMSTTAAMRCVLDTCATVDEAVAFFKKYDMHSAIGCDYHFHVIDASGKSVIIEYIDSDMRLFYPEQKRENVFPSQYMVNFYLSPDGDNHDGFGYTRYRYLQEAFAGNQGRMTEQQALNLLDKCRLSYRKQYAPGIGHDVTSLWSVVYNVNEKTATLCARMDYSKQYTFKLDEPLQVEVADRK